MADTLETPASETMEIETPTPAPTPTPTPTSAPTPTATPAPASEAEDTPAVNGAASKRPRDEEAAVDERKNNEAAKKPKSEISVEEKTEVTLGPKTFGSGIEMFEYFVKFIRFWTPDININKYEHTVLLELLKKGHLEPDQKIGTGVRAFQVRYHPQFKSRCFFLIREDGSADDFSFRKCVNHILPLPENMQLSNDDNGGRYGGGGRGGGRGRGRGRGGRGGKPRY